MNDKRLALYESLIRLSLILIFVFTLVIGSVGLVSICWMLAQTGMPRPELVTTVPADTL